MNNYSENWRHLKLILAGHEDHYRESKPYSYEDHIHAKALSIFLTNATLATPVLSRATVGAILAGHCRWPHETNLDQYKGIDLPLSFFEKNGLLTFHADWCTVNCQEVRDLDNVDPSLIPLAQTIKHLKDICYGRDGYIQPRYTCQADELNDHLSVHFGSLPIATLLPELQLNNGIYELPPENQSFSPLVCTALWFRLRDKLEPKEAFKSWILFLRVNCDWAMPVLFDDSAYEERTAFNEQLAAYVALDPSLCCTADTLWRQCISTSQFSSIVTPIDHVSQITIDLEENTSTTKDETIELSYVTLDSLESAYPSFNADDSDDIQFIQEWQQARHWPDLNIFYTWLLATTLEDSIHIDGSTLSSSAFADTLLELATTRPALKHILFNLTQHYKSSSFILFLLSQPSYSEVALFHLAQKSLAQASRASHSFLQHFDKGYQQLVCHEFLRAINAEIGSGERLLRAVSILGNRCSLHAKDYTKRFEYDFLLNLLECLSNQNINQLGQAVTRHLAAPSKLINRFPSPHHWYLVGFWLIERLENTGIDPTDTLCDGLKVTLLNYYHAEFETSLSGEISKLEANLFFSTLPWHKLIGKEGVGPLLALSTNPYKWQQDLYYSNKKSLAIASTLRHYLQVLMTVGRAQIPSQHRDRISNRVVNVVIALGFANEHALSIFNGIFHKDEYDLWTSFCLYTNILQDPLYEDLFEGCVATIPLDQLLILFERCQINARAQRLLDKVAERELAESEDLGLAALEKAFVSAYQMGRILLVTKLIDDAKSILSEARFSGSKNPYVIGVRQAWLSYEYKSQLLQLSHTPDITPGKFEEEVLRIPLPHERDDTPVQHGGGRYRRDCEQFRRYFIAAAWCETDPNKCVAIMEALYRESNDKGHSFMLFQGRLGLQKIGQDAVRLRYALMQFLESLHDLEPDQMPLFWVVAILDTFWKLHDSSGIDAFWMRLDQIQQERLEILYPYCQALIERGDPLIAHQIFNRYLKLNPQVFDEPNTKDLIDKLYKALPKDPPITQLIQLVNEESQRSLIQLSKHYAQIVSKEFEDYVAIVDPALLPHEFLKKIVLEVAYELLLRKKNLQIHTQGKNDRTDIRITKEDLINDWFTSLFDKRMAEANIGLRDQKRAGQSKSGDQPGEIDGFITGVKNKRIAIFEAFRLFSKDTTVIAEHLDKIAGYDNESLSPVFMMAYCDVGNFEALTSGYAEYIANKVYSGFNFSSGSCSRIEIQKDTHFLWLGMERRLRNHQEVIFYHLLLNMRMEDKPAS
ncbi:hypothetical protein [Chromobacterium phragmitis]|uniref:Uncharacterized protein n=1 Tax=Chromobacterium phragmitis TaxID=2202141 RepID=A0ABV0IWZ6_9NEIS